jgi:hypothetical protein
MLAFCAHSATAIATHYLPPKRKPHMNTAVIMISCVNRSSIKTVPLVCRTVALPAHLI